ncbi:MAG: hypothetical protein MUP62_01530, partial [Dehalococcoidia bacterium]|nr:hypothetical protein [Dehalococcoidia bacterium]
LTAGYEPGEVQQAVALALDRWRAVAQAAPATPGASLRFVISLILSLSKGEAALKKKGCDVVSTAAIETNGPKLCGAPGPLDSLIG